MSLSGLTYEEKLQLLKLLEEKEARQETGGHLVKLFPEEGPYSRHNYPRHMEFIRASKDYKTIFFMGANRCLAEGTLVATPKGPVPIEKLEVGGYVFDRYGIPTKVLATWANGKRETIEVCQTYVDEDGEDNNYVLVRCTPDHEIDCIVLEEDSYLISRGREQKVQAKDLNKNTFVRTLSQGNVLYESSLTIKNKKEVNVYDITVEHPEHIFLLANGLAVSNCGKALHLQEEIMTPEGPQKLEDLSVGDYVIDEEGNPVKITGYFPQGEKDCYKFVTYDGSEIISSEDHLWLTRTTKDGTNGNFSIKTTKDIVEDTNTHVLPNRPCINYSQRDLPIDPYLLGCLIGDGGLSGRSVLLTTADEEIVNYCEEIAADYECVFKKQGQKYAYQFVSQMPSPDGYNYNLLKDIIDGYGLNKTSHFKHIPDDYKYGHREDRIAILQGLMDTDGYCGKAGHVEFYSVCKQLAEDVRELVWSLGGNCSLKIKKGRYLGKPHYSYRVYIYSGSLDFCPFRLSRKKENFSFGQKQARGLSIKEKIYLGKLPCACIKVDSSSGLFLGGDHLVTHNTELGCYMLACFLTGKYPDWWEGKTFDGPIEAWAASDTSSTTRDILQFKLLGQPGALGTGMLAADDIANVRMKSGVPDAIESVKVKHKDGGYSWLGFKSYDQGRRTFQGTAKNVILLDEEPRDDGIVSECVVRTMTTGGIVMITATPLLGLTPLVQSFMDKADTPHTKEEFAT